MKIARTNNATRNMFWGIINKIVTLLVPFICRAAIIQIFGINYIGLNSLFTSILSTLNLAELGFGSAVVFFMYKAVAEDDNKTICELLAFFKNVYRVVGSVILVLGLCLIPFLKYFINADVPEDINIYIIYIITLLSTVMSYFLFSYMGCVLNATQRNDVVLNISTIVNIFEKTVQLVAIFLFRNYYIYIGIILLAGILNNLLTKMFVNKMYPDYKPYGKLSKEYRAEIRKKIYGLFMYKIGNIISGSADTIVISSFLGLSILGKYGNYYFVISTLFGILSIFYSAIRAGIGNSLVVETREKNLHDFKVLQFMQNWIVCWCTVCLFTLFQDFIGIYAGDKNKLSFGMVIIFCAYFWAWKIQDIVAVYKEAAGVWNQDKYRTIISALANLTLNIISVRFIGLYGVLLSTVLSCVVIDMPWATRVLFKNCFDKGMKDYFLMLLKSIIETTALCAVTYFACSFISFNSRIFTLFTKAFVCLILPNALYILFNHRSSEFKESILRIKAILKIRGR